MLDQTIGHIISNEFLVFEIVLEIPNKNLFYRWVHPKYKTEMEIQLYQHDIDPSIVNESFKYTYLDKDDIIEKLKALFFNKDLDKKNIIEISIRDDDFICLAKEAHKKDVTINELINEFILRDFIKQKRKKQFSSF